MSIKKLPKRKKKLFLFTFRYLTICNSQTNRKNIGNASDTTVFKSIKWSFHIYIGIWVHCLNILMTHLSQIVKL